MCPEAAIEIDRENETSQDADGLSPGDGAV
jgi:hypothetical protein